MTGDLLPVDQAQALAWLDETRRQIARAEDVRDIDFLADLRNGAGAAQLYYRRRGSQKHANVAGEVKVRCERSLGRIDVDEFPHGGNRRSEDFQEGSYPPLEKRAGVSEDTLKAWRKIGKVGDARFEEFVGWAWEDEDSGVTTARLIEYLRTGSQGSSVTFECYTPEKYIEAARRVLGLITRGQRDGPGRAHLHRGGRRARAGVARARLAQPAIRSLADLELLHQDRRGVHGRARHRRDRAHQRLRLRRWLVPAVLRAPALPD